MQAVDAIIFDKDGTLFDFQATWTAPFLRLLDDLPAHVSRPRAAEVLGFDLEAVRFHPDSVVIAGTTGEVASVLAPVIGCAPMDVVAMLNTAGSGARQMPAVPLRPCLERLRSRFVLGLVTNDSEAPARRHLAQEEVLDLFAFVAGYDSGYGAKPAPGQLLGFAEVMGLAPEVTLMVGDSRHDLAAGRAAGMRTVGVLTGVAGPAELADLADVILPDIGHLEAWIDGEITAD